MTGYTRQSTADIAAGEVVRAAPVNAEFNKLEQAFNGGTGHSHDGTTGNSPRIVLTTSVSGVLPFANGGTGATTQAGAQAALGLVPGTDVQAYDPDLASIASLTAIGFFCHSAANTSIIRSLQGTANEITITNGTGAGGNPTFSLPTSMTMTGKTLTGGTYDNALYNNPTINNIIINSGTIAGTHTGDGAGLTNLNAANIATGSITAAVHGNQAGGNLHAVATSVADGFMQAADKTKMDGITAGAQPTSLTLIQTALNTLPVDSTPATSESMYSNASQFTITNLKDTLQISYDTRYYIPGATSASEFRSSVAGMQFRAITGGTSAAMHVDANDFYILFSDTATGTYNSRRPLRLNRSTGMFSDTAFTASGRVSGSDLLSGSVVYAGGGSAYLNTDGNIIGPTWTSSSLYAHIESRANAFGAAYQNGSVTSTRMAGNVTPVVSFGNGGGFQEFSGYVVTGIRSSTSNSIGWSARQPQVYTANGGWVAAFAF